MGSDRSRVSGPLHALLAGLIAISASAGQAAELPLPCVAGACGPAVTGFVTSGTGSATSAGNVLNVLQSSDNATFNWQSFNISADGTVNFSQPDAASIALNRIFQADPSRIFGALNANGRIFLINQNGILFGEGAQINVGGLVASTLNITPEALELGIAQAARVGQPAFRTFTDENGAPLPSGMVRIARAASITTSDGGQVLVFAPEVVNEGTIRTPGGQTILAAGDSVYLLASSDPNLRGLLVEVGTGGTVTNGAASNAQADNAAALVGNIVAERGNVTLAGLAVNQLGRINATTSVRFNGGVRLLAQDGATVSGAGSTTPVLSASRGGTVTLGERSAIDISLDSTDTGTAVDINPQPRSQVTVQGDQIRMLGGASIRATAGNVTLSAQADPGNPISSSDSPSNSRVYVASGARIDVSGASVELPMERNVLEVQLRGNELRDSPEQRNSALRGQTVRVDLRRSGTRADGSRWEGTPIADLAGNIDTVARGVAERNLAGGTVTLQSQGDVILAPAATVDVSGGSIRYLDGFVATSQLVSNGRVYDIGDADPDRDYQGVVNGYTQTYSRWGVVETFPGFPRDSRGTFVRGYQEGKDAGLITLLARNLVADADFVGRTTIGRNQRLPGASFNSDTRLYRPADQVPLAARLVIGNATPRIDTTTGFPNFVGPDLRFESNALLPTLTNLAGLPFDPLLDPFPDEVVTLLRPSVLGPQRIGRLAVFSNGRISVPADAALAVGDGGELRLTAGQIDFAGSASGRGATVALRAQPTAVTPAAEASVQMLATAAIDVSGRWVNDNEALGPATTPLFTSGGTVRIEAQGAGLDLASGALIDASGGAHRRSDGRIVAGRGGSIVISAAALAANPDVAVQVDAQLRAYSLGAGGSLSLAANSICIAQADCRDDDAATLWVTPDALTRGGFASYSLTSSRGDLVVAPGTQVRPRVQSLQIAGDVSLAPSDTLIGSLTDLVALPDRLRAPVNLSLRTSIGAAPQGGPVGTAEDFARLGELNIGSGALFDMDIGAQLALASSTRMLVDGTLVAPAGRVSLELENTLQLQDFFDTQAIWLGPNARLAAPGAVRTIAGDSGLRSGEVLGGGVVSVRANRGYFVMDPLSSIDVSGTSATLDVRSPDGAPSPFQPQLVGSDGGVIDLSVAEGAYLNGSLTAQAGGGAGAAGGELRLRIDPANRLDPGIVTPSGAPVAVFPLGTRSIRVSQSDGPLVAGYGLPVARTLNGLATLSAATVTDGGFTSLLLTSRDTFELGSVTPQTFGEIVFGPDLSLALARLLVLDAPSIVAGGGRVELAARYLAIGSQDRFTQQLATATLGTGELHASADFIELIGSASLQNFGSVHLDSRGDLRLRGVQLAQSRELRGTLLAAGELELTAAQIYPTTLTQYDVRVDDGTITLSGAGEGDAVLSAGGTLRLSAARIEHAGVLRAPFGRIELTADDLTLAAGSLTSTSAQGALIPFGSTQGGFDWAYELEDLQTLIFGAGQLPIPQQRVALAGERVNVLEGATIDVSGGGDYYASEFLPGVGGSRDVLSATVRPNTFAIVPGLDLTYAPYDQREYTGSGLRPGDSVTLGEGAGVPAGTYALLPARYALLPGAYLVAPVGGYQDIASGERYAQLDGSIVVGGRNSFVDSPFAASRTSGFAVRPGQEALREAQYAITRASQFFPAQAGAADAALPRLPRDAGVLAITAGNSLALDGRLLANAATGGRGAAVDISGDRLRVATSGASVDPGEVLLDFASLNALGAESLLLGGSRGTTSEGIDIDVAAESVTIGAGVSLRAPEILLAARDSVLVQSGAQLLAQGAATEGGLIDLGGDGAFVRVATGSQAQVRRSSASGVAGTLEIGTGALLSAPGGSVVLDAARDALSNGTLALQGGSLSLGAAAISLGDAPAGGLVLRALELENLDLEELVLNSRSTLDLYGNVELGVDSLAINAGAIRGFGDGSANLRAGRIEIGNLSGAAPGTSGTGTGLLSLAADEISLTGGVLGASGFSSITLAASEALVASGNGEFTVAGDLALAAPIITGASGVRHAFTAAGVLSTAGASGSAAGQLAQSLGAWLTLQGRSVNHAGLLAARSGVIELVATGAAAADGVTLLGGSRIDVSGGQHLFDGVTVQARAGNVRLAATGGDVSVATGATLDLSGNGSGVDAGALHVSAIAGRASLAGTLRGSAAVGARSGEFSVDAAAIGSLDSLNAVLNAGGFAASRLFRQRGAGDLTVGGSSTVRADRVHITADQGAIAVNGLIDASSTSGGTVSLDARDRIDIAGRIDARATGIGRDGGRVDLRSGNGGVFIAAPARIDVAGRDTDGAATATGALALRLTREAVNTVLDADAGNDQLRLAGTMVGARSLSVEAFRIYDEVDGVIDAAEGTASAANARFADADAFMGSAAAVRAALGRTDDPAFRLLPGVEIRSAGDMRLAADWNLFGWRFGDAPGVLTLRAAGELIFDRSLSDGFAAITGAGAFTLPTTPGDSWSYRLIAGADTASADPLAVLSGQALAPGKGSLRIAAGALSTNPTLPSTARMIRTGTGSIEIAAALDLVLGNRASVIYTAGAASETGVPLTGLGNRAYPTGGGDISIRAGRDVVGAPTNQLVTDWQWRVGRTTGAPLSATGWTVNFGRFEQGVATLGGGDVTVTAGRDVRDLSVSTPTVGRQDGGTIPAQSRVTVLGGGDLEVTALGTIAGGSFYVGRGSGALRADALAASLVAGQEQPYPVLALGDGRFDVTTRLDLGIEGVVNPTLLRQGRSQNDFQFRSFFSTYGADSAVSLTSLAGDVVLNNDRADLASRLTSIAFSINNPDERLALSLYAPWLRATSLSGDVAVNGSMTLFPAPKGNLELFAARNVNLVSSTGIEVIVSDADPQLLPSVAIPQASFSSTALAIGTTLTTSPLFHARTPVHADASQPDGLPDSSPVRVVAREGSIVMEADLNAGAALISVPKAARVIAGTDIVDLGLAGQHVRPGDVTSLIAGRDIRYTNERDELSQIRPSTREIALAGPGTLELRAGRNVDLQTSRGITTLGNLANLALSDEGADVSVSAGLGANGQTYTQFIQRYLEQGSQYDAQLFAYLELVLGSRPATKVQALAQFGLLSQSHQAPFIETVFFAELRASGRVAAAAGNSDFRRAFEAIETLYPGANPDLDAGESNPYAGGINLYFSRIYTLDGGDVTLLVPGGAINAGLAAAPAAFGIRKDPDQLGVVAQSVGSINAFSFGDFQVNESRVFAADGGNILVWSTRGDIDAGRGAKTAISAPPPLITFDENGNPKISFPAALTGSGIQTLATSPGRKPGDVDLFAPRGVVNAGDAGIVAGNLTIAATAVLGAGNISVSGTSVGVPVDTGGLSAGLTGVSNVASGASNAATTAVEEGAKRGGDKAAPLGDAALGWLEVFVLGFGEEVCKDDDIECLKRNQKQ